MNQSPFGKLNIRDAVHGFVIAFLTATLSGVVAILDAGQMPTAGEIKTHALIGLTAGVSYVLKNVFSNSNGQILKKEAE
jgi:N-acetylmuramic acid 6-phosphate (MurNAc-6-P) etherase